MDWRIGKGTSGVPRGSVLGPLLVFIFINDIAPNISFTVRLYSDDWLICRAVSTDNDMHSLQQGLDYITLWCNTRKIGLNAYKSYHVTGSKGKRIPNTRYAVGNKVPLKFPEFKYLGAFLSEYISFNQHINNTVKKAASIFSLIIRNLHGTTQMLKMAPSDP